MKWTQWMHCSPPTPTHWGAVDCMMRIWRKLPPFPLLLMRRDFGRRIVKKTDSDSDTVIDTFIACKFPKFNNHNSAQPSVLRLGKIFFRHTAFLLSCFQFLFPLGISWEQFVGLLIVLLVLIMLLTQWVLHILNQGEGTKALLDSQKAFPRQQKSKKNLPLIKIYNPRLHHACNCKCKSWLWL